METSEAFVLRKSSYSEADYILSLLTRDFGKITGIAKHAKKSKKRFGGRLEPFIKIRIRFHMRKGKMNFIEDTETVKVYGDIMKNIDYFFWSSFILEYIDILLPEHERNKRMFELLDKTLTELNSHKSLLPSIIKFQIKALGISGYMPNLEICTSCGNKIKSDCYLSIKRGDATCNHCEGDSTDKFMISSTVLNNPCNYIDDTETLIGHVKLLTRFTEYHTGKKFKSFDLVRELCS